MIYDCIIIGSGYASFGYAKTHKNTLIIDRGELCDRFFCGAFNVGKNWDNILKTYFAKELKSEFLKCSLLRGNMADVAALETAFCKFLSKDIPETRLLCEVAGFKKENGAFAVTAYTNSGYETFLSKKLITNEPFSKNKSICVRARAEKDEILEVFPSAKIFDGFYDGDIYFSVLSKKENMPSEKLWIIDKWCEKERNGKLTYFAPLYMYEKGKEPYEKDGITYVDETVFDNALSAYEAGGIML